MLRIDHQESRFAEKNTGLKLTKGPAVRYLGDDENAAGAPAKSLGEAPSSMAHRVSVPYKAGGRQRVLRQKKSRRPVQCRWPSMRASHGTPAAEIAIRALDRVRAPGCSAASLGGASRNWRTNRRP